MRTVVLLVMSNVFMTFAWYAHLKNLRSTPLYVAILASWGIALFEYILHVPANRAGYEVFSLGQLNIMQEVITLTLCRLLYGRTAETRLSLGRLLPGQRCFFHIPQLK